MKYLLTFLCEEPVSLPLHHNHILQAALLNWLGDEDYTAFLHDSGYAYEKRKFKLYTFSEMSGFPDYYEKEQRKLIYENRIQIYLSFYTEESRPIILKNIEGKKPLILGNSVLPLNNCEIVKEEYRDCLVKTVSPVTIHSTFELPGGRKKTYYYEPREKDFSEMIRQNLIRKYTAYTGENPEKDDFEIVPKKGEILKRVHIRYHNFIICGWKGEFYLYGSEELIRMALLSGIGARNGMGMGCLLQKYQY